ncbi:MAG: WYL domain-containing protein, partial [bacterium]
KIANERKASKGELVRLWINESIADEIRNNPIHSSQRIEQEEIDGSVNIKLNMPITQELEYFILQHESNIKIHEPAELIAQIKKLKSTMLF